MSFVSCTLVALMSDIWLKKFIKPTSWPQRSSRSWCWSASLGSASKAEDPLLPGHLIFCQTKCSWRSLMVISLSTPLLRSNLSHSLLTSTESTIWWWDPPSSNEGRQQLFDPGHSIPGAWTPRFRWRHFAWKKPDNQKGQSRWQMSEKELGMLAHIKRKRMTAPFAATLGRGSQST